jgi:ABC-type protease/lipase transport system fused ATPase/permease subunit
LNAIRQHIPDQSALAVIPTKLNTKNSIPHDKVLYRMRNIVERFFCTMKDMKRLTTRHEKLSSNFLAIAHIFAIILWANCVHTLVSVTAPVENSVMCDARSDYYSNFGGSRTMLTIFFMTTAGALAIIEVVLNMSVLITTSILTGRLNSPANQLIGQWHSYSSFLQSLDLLGVVFETQS